MAHDAHGCTATLDGSQPTGSCSRIYDRGYYVATNADGIVLGFCRLVDAGPGWRTPPYLYGCFGYWTGDAPPTIGEPEPPMESTQCYGSTGARRCDPLTDGKRLRADWRERYAARVAAEQCSARRVDRGPSSTRPTPPDVVCQCGGKCASCIAARDLRLTERHPKRWRADPPIDWKKLRGKGRSA